MYNSNDDTVKISATVTGVQRIFFGICKRQGLSYCPGKKVSGLSLTVHPPSSCNSGPLVSISNYLVV